MARSNSVTKTELIPPIYLSQLATIEILWHGDIHLLAEFLLHACDAKDQAVNSRGGASRQKSRPTLYGLASHFARLTDAPDAQIKQILQSHGLNLGATIEFDAPPPD